MMAWFFIIRLFTGSSQVLYSLAQNKLHVKHVQSNPWWLLMTRTFLLTREIGTKKRDITESLHVYIVYRDKTSMDTSFLITYRVLVNLWQELDVIQIEKSSVHARERLSRSCRVKTLISIESRAHVCHIWSGRIYFHSRAIFNFFSQTTDVSLCTCNYFPARRHGRI